MLNMLKYIFLLNLNSYPNANIDVAQRMDENLKGSRFSMSKIT